MAYILHSSFPTIQPSSFYQERILIRESKGFGYFKKETIINANNSHQKRTFNIVYSCSKKCLEDKVVTIPEEEPLFKIHEAVISFSSTVAIIAMLLFGNPLNSMALSPEVSSSFLEAQSQTLVSSIALPFSFPNLSNPDAMMSAMDGMSMPNFNPRRYMGRWYEVSSIKRGFAGQGQEDCHCTQGVYSLDEVNKQIEVDTFCVHGSPDGYLTGIRGKVNCLQPDELVRTESAFEKKEKIRLKCFLRFPSIPFIPKLTYDVIDTDYDTYALVSGAKDRSFVQIYSRTPNPGPEFIKFQKAKLVGLGFEESDFRDTPQDCPVVEMEVLKEMMSKDEMDKAMDNVLPGKLPSQSELEEILKKRKF